MVKAPSQATHPLATLNVIHQELLEQLQSTQDPQEQEALIAQAMANQTSQATLVDLLALIGQSLEAELESLEARKRYYLEQIKAATAKVERWQTSLENAIVKAHLQHQLPKKMLGQHSFIQLRLSPGRTEIEDEALLPPEYLRTKTWTEPDKDAIKLAWKQGVTVPGTRIDQRFTVSYSPAPTSFEGMVRKAKRQASS